MHLLAQNWIKCVNMAFLALKCNFFITRENMAVKTFFKLISYFHGSYKQGQTSSSYILNEMGLQRQEIIQILAQKSQKMAFLQKKICFESHYRFFCKFEV